MIQNTVIFSLVLAAVTGYVVILDPNGLLFGLGLLTAALGLSVFEWLRNRRKTACRLRYKPDPALFKEPPLKAEGLLFTTFSDSPEYVSSRMKWLLFWLFLTAAILLMAKTQTQDNRWLVAAAPLSFGPPVILLYLLLKRNARMPEPTAELAARIPRQTLDTASEADRDLLARYWRNPAEAAIALEVAELFHIGLFFFPEDDYAPFIGGPLHMSSRIRRHFGPVSVPYECTGKTFADLVAWLMTPMQPDQVSELIGAIPVPQATGPEKSEFLLRLDRLMANPKATYSEKEIFDELKRRPPFESGDFCSRWPDAESARIALLVRDAAIETLERPATATFYPDDPMPLLTWLDWDDLEIVEFLYALEEKFGFVIPDEIAPELFWHRSFATLVEYIRTRRVRRD